MRSPELGELFQATRLTMSRIVWTENGLDKNATVPSRDAFSLTDSVGSAVMTITELFMNGTGCIWR